MNVCLEGNECKDCVVMKFKYLYLIESLYKSTVHLPFNDLGAFVSLFAGFHLQPNRQTERPNQETRDPLRLAALVKPPSTHTAVWI